MSVAEEKVSSLRKRLIKGATGSFALNVAGTGLSFIASVLLARLLGAKDFGTYTYAITWVGFLSFITVFGFDNLLIRNVALYKTQSSWDLMAGILNLANRLVLWLSFSVSLLAAIVALILISHLKLDFVLTFCIAINLLPLMGLTRIKLATLRGLNYVVIGQLPETILRPLLFIILLSIVAWFGKDIGAPMAMVIQLTAVGIAFIIGNIFLQKSLPYQLQSISPTYETFQWMRSGFNLFLIGGMSLMNSRIDTLMIGAIQGSEAVGIYTVAYRGAEFSIFFLLAVNTVLAPTVAKLYAESDIKKMQKLVTKSNCLTFLISLPIGLTMIFFGEIFLSLFGSDFNQGRLALSILTTSYLFYCSLGSSGLLLVMTGHESKMMIVSLISALTNMILNAIMISLWGISGAALASAISLSLWIVLLTILVKINLGIKVFI
jgi:O-antigen/teichoic acid export membrane protein